MLTRIFLAFLFSLKCRLASSDNNVIGYIRRKYDASVLYNYRRLESSTRRLRKAQLDYDFLLYCKMGNIIPNFVKFKLYRSSLYNTDFYKDATMSLLELEIDFKCKAIKRLQVTVNSLSQTLFQSLSILDGWYIRSLLDKNIEKFVSVTTEVHEKKLFKLGIQQPKFMSPKDVIFNFSDHKLSNREEFLLSLGLDFCLPNYKPKFANYFLPFELLFNNLRHLPSHVNLEAAQQAIQNIAHRSFAALKKTPWFPFFKYNDYNILKQLSKVKNFVISRPDTKK